MAKQLTHLQELAELLRGAHRLGPQTRGALAKLLEELNQTVDPTYLSGPARANLEENAAQLIQALRGEAEEGLLHSARNRLEETAVRLEAEAPQVTGVLRRLIEALANLGI